MLNILLEILLFTIISVFIGFCVSSSFPLQLLSLLFVLSFLSINGRCILSLTSREFLFLFSLSLSPPLPPLRTVLFIPFSFVYPLHFFPSGLSSFLPSHFSIPFFPQGCPPSSPLLPAFLRITYSLQILTRTPFKPAETTLIRFPLSKNAY